MIALTCRSQSDQEEACVEEVSVEITLAVELM